MEPKKDMGSPRVDLQPHQFDKSNMLAVILEAPRQFAEGFDLARDIHVNGKFGRVIFYGEGGSAFPFALVDAIARDVSDREGKTTPLISQNYTYSLEPEASRDALNIFCSYSGNTEEALKTLGAAIKAGLPTVGLASGARLEDICKKAGVPFVKLPKPTANFQPRMGTGYQVAAGLQILVNHGFIGGVKDEIVRQAKDFEASMGDYNKTGEELAEKIADKIPLVWSSQKFKELARVWTIKINEHAKRPAFANFFPEVNHNLMVGLTNLSDDCFVIMLRDPQDDPENLRRYEITADILKGYGVDSVILDLVGDSVFAKMFNSIYTADFTAYHLAGNNGIDPTPVDMVEQLKERLDPNFGKN